MDKTWRVLNQKQKGCSVLNKHSKAGEVVQMKGYWHIIALSILAAYFTAFYSCEFLLIGFFAWIAWLYRKRRLSPDKAAALLCFTVTFGIYYHLMMDGNDTSLTLSNAVQLHEGQITGPVSESPQKVTFTLETAESGQKILVTYFKNAAALASSSLPTVKRGAECTLKGKQEMLPRPTNPGQFDYRRYMNHQSMDSQIILNSPEDITCSGSSFLTTLDRARAFFISNNNNHLSTFTSSWLNALLLGDDSYLASDTILLFQKWGLSHLLAISGLHVGLLISILYIVSVKSGVLTKESMQLCLLNVLPIYAFLAGEASSVWRAVLLAVIVIVLSRLKVKLPFTDCLSIIFIVLFLIDHQLIHQIGFQFSYLVTFALLLSARKLAFENSRLSIALLVSFIAQLVILPIQINNFYFFQPLAILVNLFVVPYFTIVVIPLMFALEVTVLVIPLFSQVMDVIFSMIHQQFLALLAWVNQHLDYSWILGRFPPLLLVPYCILFILFMGRVMDENRNRAFRYGLLITCLLLSISIAPYFRSTGTVTMLDVGQGDCFIIELPYRKGVIIIDAAGTVADDFKTPNDKIYRQVIKPFLYSKGISKIDMVILSHDDLDHTGSIPYLLADFQVDEVIVSRYHEISSALANEIRGSHASVRRSQSGEMITVKGQSFYVLSPRDDYKDSNGNSLVIFTELGGKRWLFTGDIGEQMEIKLAKNYPSLTAYILKVSHHGSKTSTSENLLKTLGADMAWISVGSNNRYGHPSPQVIDRLEKYQLEILRTDEHGAVQYNYKGEEGTFSWFMP
ncbi:DNA internalization-related competence protein ComEC/Rec2 [Sediminibacillus albus]|uniref:Competence protein ComEC n=1 Tax=Sediminibacillus albus TaxID=407036 RepID=A0A1G9CNG7_9BACI|nr:DNA internalization-related competence protein ComEC/Rec2 [Sediminibacillus albus]SDK53004.1 competence protein ComEC [Sediminibacillus albus]